MIPELRSFGILLLNDPFGGRLRMMSVRKGITPGYGDHRVLYRNSLRVVSYYDLVSLLQ